MLLLFNIYAKNTDVCQPLAPLHSLFLSPILFFRDPFSRLNIVLYTSRNWKVLNFIFMCQVEVDIGTINLNFLSWNLVNVQEYPLRARDGVRYGVKTEACEFHCKKVARQPSFS